VDDATNPRLWHSAVPNRAVKRSGFRKLAFWFSRLPSIAWQTALEHRAIRVAKRQRWREFELFDYEVLEEEQRPIAKVVEALLLIEQLDPRRYRRIAHDVPRILVARANGARYWFVTNTCLLDLNELERDSTGMTALAIVHEAIHARLARQGIFSWPHLRYRIERRCVAEERTLVDLLRHAGWEGTEKVAAWLDSSLQTPWWAQKKSLGRRRNSP